MAEGSGEWTDADLKELHKVLNDKGAEVHAVLKEAGFSNHECLTFAVTFTAQMALTIGGQAIMEIARLLSRWYYAYSIPALDEIKEAYGVQQVKGDGSEEADSTEPTERQP